MKSERRNIWATALLLAAVFLIIGALFWWSCRRRPVIGQEPTQRRVVDLETFEGCSMQGDAQSARLQSLNLLKNRYLAPGAADIDERITLRAMVAPGPDKDRFRPDQAVTVVGYVNLVRKGGVETVNCRAQEVDDRDTHVEIVPDAADLGDGTRVLISEVTPRLREIARRQGEDWSTATLRSKYTKGTKVRVTGWLMFDLEHSGASENTNPGGAKNWRATAWEIHPITAIEAIR